MKNRKQSTICPASLGKPVCIGLSIAIASISITVFGESYTGKIVIDDVVIGDNNANITKGSAVNGHDKRVINVFHSIQIQGGIDVNYRPSQSVLVDITGDTNLLALITTQVNDGVLVISSSDNYQTKIPLVIELSSPSLNEVSLLGSGDVNLQGLNEKDLSLNISGSGNITVEGKVEKLSAQVSGSGDINAKNLVSEQADVQITGSGNIKVTVTEFLKGNIIGSGDIIYSGNPQKIEPNVIGSGDIVASD